MKHWLLFIGFIFICLPGFSSQEDFGAEIFIPGQEGIMQEQTPDLPQKIETLSKDLKGCNFLTPRRAFQTFAYNSPARLLRHAGKLLHDTRIKGDGQLQKINEYHTFCQTLNFSSLLCGRGYHLYTLRKLLI